MRIENQKLLRALLFRDFFTKIVLVIVVSQSTLAYALESNLNNSNQFIQNASVQGQVQNLSNQILGTRLAIDINREGWDQTTPYTSDPSGDNGGIGRVDWKTITLAHDCDDLFVRYQTTDGPAFVPDGLRYSLFIDVDKNPRTGYRGHGKLSSIGAEVLIQGGQNKVTTLRFVGSEDQENWNWEEIKQYFITDIADSGRDVEYRIRILDLNVLGNRVTDFNWVAVADYPTGVKDFYPDGGNLGDEGDYKTYNFNYSPITEGFSNPERGFFEANQTQSSKYESLDVPTLQCFRQNEGISLIHRIFYLENFVNSDISQEYLDLIQADFDKIRQAGLKVIPRFAYSESASGTDETPIYGDASKARILSHLSQLSNVLRSNSDVIALMQAGFIGLWGEWFFSDHFQPDADWSDRSEILTGILDVLPANRAVQLRTPRYKQNIFSDFVPVDQSSAHDESYRTRIGHHNDCFVSSKSDGGTYVDTSTELPYLEEESKWVAVGGETCDFHFLSDPAPNRLECATALAELDQFNWSYLNQDFYKPTLQKWLGDGCFSEINKRLGYHLTLLNGTYDDQVNPGGKFKYSFQIKNDGFSAPFNPRKVELIFRSTDGSSHTVELADDPRFWLSGELQTISGEITIPDNMSKGEFELLLNLPDPEPQLHDRPEYSIRLANEDIWEVETGYNKLNHMVKVNSEIYYPDDVKFTIGKYNWGSSNSFEAGKEDTYDIIEASPVNGDKAIDWYASTSISGFSP
ncbi:MAG: DUF4832 domain-containing protein, partial [Methylococcaceae bacterium]|nr:DUF4832 domain-containing protein [Methylococcaceae bacterium]